MLRPYICRGAGGDTTVVISTQKAEPLKATRREKVTGYAGTDMTAPSMKENIRGAEMTNLGPQFRV